MATVGVKIRMILPRAVFDYGKVRQEIGHTMANKTAPELRKEFNKTTQSWDDKPNWKNEMYLGPNVMWVKVLTYSTQYRLVNAGARPHMIRPRRAKMLRFQTNFRAKSRPRVIGAFAGGKSGPYVSTLGVHHPGHEAREFDKEIAEQYAPTFVEDIQEAVTEGILHA